MLAFSMLITTSATSVFADNEQIKPELLVHIEEESVPLENLNLELELETKNHLSLNEISRSITTKDRDYNDFRRCFRGVDKNDKN